MKLVRQYYPGIMLSIFVGVSAETCGAHASDERAFPRKRQIVKTPSGARSSPLGGALGVDVGGGCMAGMGADRPSAKCTQANRRASRAARVVSREPSSGAFGHRLLQHSPDAAQCVLQGL